MTNKGTFSYLGCSISCQNVKDICVKISKFLQITEIINRILKTSQIRKYARLKIYRTLALPTVLYGCETWQLSIREQDKSRLTSAEIKFMRRTAKYTWQDYKTNKYTLSEIKISPVVKKIQNYLNTLIKHFRRMNRDRLPHLIMKYQPFGKRSQGRSVKRLLES